MRLWKLSYISTAVATPDEALRQLREICARSGERNARIGISSVATVHRGRFAQVLEGPESAVRALLKRIMGDPRHHSIMVLADGPIVARRYADWAMAYRDPKAFLSDQLDDILQQTADVVRAMKATWH
ncbi:BLUF domain-containing protein [Novosphingobium sp.]|uniref:BLUF domain-containing protein n=1 Tax=Novosphingobium sp. TaxID=1874826 RepID=UPI001D3C8B67|nr:BLUF domain-containing protein [Novosphingobium sp.]MBX9664531.1 BLUF domain-containing protein [Novosphingobium sp.]